MIIFTLHRILLLLITLFFLTLVSFSLSYFTPHAPLKDAAILDAYQFYFISLLHWDFGVSNINGQAISEQLRVVFPATITLCLLAFTMSLFIGIPLGIIAGMMRGKWQDIVINAFALVGFSIPVFWLALLLTLFFSLYLHWLPISGRCNLLYQVQPITSFTLLDAWLSDSPYRSEMVASALRYMILPNAALAVAPITEVVRLMRISTDDILNKNYIKAATTRGLSRLTIICRHVLHNALPPIIPKLGLQFSNMLTLAMIIEIIFSWPGLGCWLIIAMRQQDFAALSAGVIVVGTLVITINLLAEILSAATTSLKNKIYYDPR